MPALPTKPLVSVNSQLNDWIAPSGSVTTTSRATASIRKRKGIISVLRWSRQLPLVPIPPSGSIPIWIPPPGTRFYALREARITTSTSVNIKSGGTATLYSSAAAETFVLDNLQLAYSADHQVVDFAVPKAALGNLEAINTLFDVNDTVFGLRTTWPSRMSPAITTWSA
jgi:hypothetical protein